jgi:hypothetical protein
MKEIKTIFDLSQEQVEEARKSFKTSEIAKIKNLTWIEYLELTVENGLFDN